VKNGVSVCCSKVHIPQQMQVNHDGCNADKEPLPTHIFRPVVTVTNGDANQTCRERKKRKPSDADTIRSHAMPPELHAHKSDQGQKERLEEASLTPPRPLLPRCH
jgi:hypothetical protein